MNKGVFISGTDTGVGKTEVSLAIMRALQRKGMRVNAMKPVSAGCKLENGVLINPDAARLQRQSADKLTITEINRYAFEPAIAPHIAAEEAGVAISLDQLYADYVNIQQISDRVVVEGAGGWFVPLSFSQTMEQLAQRLALPVILVVGVRLGCLNHALLTYQAIKASGLSCIGWVANVINPDMLRSAENCETLAAMMDCPCLAVIPYLERADVDSVCSFLRQDGLALLQDL